jgi:1,4-alpha-glucan branching enzyme
MSATAESRGKITGTTQTVKEPFVAEKVKASISSEKQRAEPLGIKKEYKKSRKICRATFTLPGEAAPKDGKVTILGDFDNWDKEASPLKRLANGDFVITLNLATGKEYRFRYLIDGKIWENDCCADKYVKSPYGVEDSVVCA